MNSEKRKDILNNIVESYCSFEVSKLLKEKGFENEFCQCYTEGREFYISPNLLSERITGKKRPATIPAPTYSIAIEWIRLNFGIWITITSISQESWQCHITKKGDSLGKLCFEDFNSPQEATEAALKYILEELI